MTDEVEARTLLAEMLGLVDEYLNEGQQTLESALLDRVRSALLDPRPAAPWYSIVRDVKPFSLNDELRWHKMKRHEVVKEWRGAFFWLAKQAQIPRLTRIEVEVIPRGVGFDIDGIAGCAKSALDGIVDAGVVPGDDQRYVVGMTYRPSQPGSPALELRVRQVSDEVDLAQLDDDLG